MKNKVKIIVISFLTLGLVSAISAQIEVNGKKLNSGDIHINEWEGLFVSNLNGDYSIIINVDYDSRSMSASIIDNETQKVTCLPNDCNYQ